MFRKTGLLILILIVVTAAALLSRPRRGPNLAATGVIGGASAEDTSGFARATGPQPLSFPADYGPHPDYQTEWWYYTGNLDDAAGRHFGYQFTIFRRAVLPAGQRPVRASDWAADQVYMGHFALTDVVNEKHYGFERFSRGAVGLAGAQARPFRVWLEDWELAGTAADVFPMRLRAQDGGAQRLSGEHGGFAGVILILLPRHDHHITGEPQVIIGVGADVDDLFDLAGVGVDSQHAGDFPSRNTSIM